MLADSITSPMATPMSVRAHLREEADREGALIGLHGEERAEVERTQNARQVGLRMDEASVEARTERVRRKAEKLAARRAARAEPR